MNNWGRWNPCACWSKSWTDLVCLWPPSTDDKQGLSFILSVSVILSPSVPDRHTMTHTSKHTKTTSHTRSYQLLIIVSLLTLYCSSKRLRTLLPYLQFKKIYILIIITQLKSFNQHLLHRRKPLHSSLTQVYFGLMKTKWKVFSAMWRKAFKWPVSACLCVNKGMEVKLRT